jgi:hypothetical protein
MRWRLTSLSSASSRAETPSTDRVLSWRLTVSFWKFSQETLLKCSCHCCFSNCAKARVCAVCNNVNLHLLYKTKYFLRKCDYWCVKSLFLYSWGVVGWDWVQLVRPPLVVRCSSYGWWMCGTFGLMRIGRGNRSTRRKPVPVLLFPQKLPYDLTLDRIWAASVGRRLPHGLTQITYWRMLPLSQFSGIDSSSSGLYIDVISICARR